MKNESLTVTISKSEYDDLKSVNDELKCEIESLKSDNAELTAKVNWLMAQFRLAKHRQFGASSEKSEYDQINFFNEAEKTADINILEPELTEIEKHYRKKKRSAKDRLPEDLPVETVVHELEPEECNCPECGGKLHVMGHGIREELKLIPAKAVIVKHIQSVYACRHCEKDECGVPIVKAPLVEPVIKGSFASPEAVAHIMCQKFVMGAPLYRQEQEWNRYGIMLSRQTMSNWLLKATEDWLEPVYDMLRELLISSYQVLHADETTLQVLHEPGKSAQSKSYIWLYRTSGDVKDAIVLYEYQPERKAKHPKAFLDDFKGYLHTDGYEAYHNLPEDITVVGCWAHARRKFDEALKGVEEKDRKDSFSLIGKRFCDKLFDIERGIKDLSAQERFQKRQELSKPVLDMFFSWLNSIKVTPKTGVGNAVRYTLDQWKYLERYIQDGRLEISNNRAERSIKPFVIDRKNFLFCNTPRGAKASAVMFSLIETAKENGLNPFAYLTYIFQNAPNWNIRNNIDRLALFIPWFVPDFCKAKFKI
jgi:transposase